MKMAESTLFTRTAYISVFSAKLSSSGDKTITFLIWSQVHICLLIIFQIIWQFRIYSYELILKRRSTVKILDELI